jgi:hypothetical protein
MSKLGTYRYIDNDKLKNKFEVTSLLEPSNLLDSYYKNTLKDFSPDAPTFAYEESRKNTDSVAKLNTHYYGRRNATEPFQNDLFLGFTDKDPRSIHNEPLMGKYQEQIWHRKDDYKFSFKDDSDNSIPTAGISESQMQKNKKISYSGFKDRYKNFEESNDAWTNGFNIIKSDKSKVYLHDVDDTIPNLSNIQDLQNRRDYISTISLEALPVGWNSLPDQKIKIAKYNQLFKNFNLKDINIIKNKNEQLKDNKNRTLDTEQQLLKQLILFTENIKNKKKDNFKNQDIKYKDSKLEQIRKINKNKEYFKNNEIINTHTDDKKSKLIDVLNNKLFKNKEYTILNEIFYKVNKSNNENFLTKGNNKEQYNTKCKNKNDIINELLYQSIKSNNDHYLTKGNNKDTNNNKSGIKYLKSNLNEFKYHNNLINNDKLNKNNNNYEIFNYSSKIKDYKNNYNSVKNTQEKKLHHYDNEKNNQHRKPNNQSNDALHQDDFDIDGEFNESGYKDRNMGIHGSKYLFNKKEYESNMNDSSINESTNLSLKKNHFS